MLCEFTTCMACDCNVCSRNYCCPKTDMADNPCIECCGTPPYAPYDVDESNLHEFNCDENR